MSGFNTFSAGMGAGPALAQINGMAELHNHNPDDPGNGGKIPTTALSGMIGTNVLSGNIAGVNISGPVASASTATTMNGVRVNAFMLGDQSITNTIQSTKIQFDRETIDSNNVHNTSTYVTTPGIGTYLVILKAKRTAIVNAINEIQIWLNSGIIAAAQFGENYSTIAVSLIQITNPTDTISGYAYTGIGGTAFTIDGGSLADTTLTIIQIA